MTFEQQHEKHRSMHFFLDRKCTNLSLNPTAPSRPNAFPTITSSMRQRLRNLSKGAWSTIAGSRRRRREYEGPATAALTKLGSSQPVRRKVTQVTKPPCLAMNDVIKFDIALTHQKANIALQEQYCNLAIPERKSDKIYSLKSRQFKASTSSPCSN